MDDRRPDPLTDEALDREIHAALEVDPSPDFLARVRTRIGEDPTPAGWLRWPIRLWWPIQKDGSYVRRAGPFGPAFGPAIAACAAVLALAVAASYVWNARTVPATTSSTSASDPPAAAQPQPVESAVSPGITAENIPKPAPSRRTPAPAPASGSVKAGDVNDIPEVLISQADVDAFHRVLASAQARRFELPPKEILAVGTQASGEITFTPITIDPLQPIEPLKADEGVRQ